MNIVRSHFFHNKGIIPVILLFLLLALYYSYFTPLWNPPDEERHFASSEYIAQHHKPPYLNSDEEEVHITEVTHPPLFYILGSLFCGHDGTTIHEKIILNDGPGYISFFHPKNETTFPYAGKARSAHLLRLLSVFLAP